MSSNITPFLFSKVARKGQKVRYRDTDSIERLNLAGGFVLESSASAFSRPGQAGFRI